MDAQGTGAQRITRRFDIDDLDVLEQRARPGRRRTERLTARELDVLERLAEGRPTEEVAALLHVSPHTVRSRIKAVLRKLGARNREHAVAIALRDGAIDPEL